MIRRLLGLALLACATTCPAAPQEFARARPLHICANEALGAPDGGAMPYLMLQRALEQLPGLRVEISPLPWNRCLEEAGTGRYDAVLSASFSVARAYTLHYPLRSNGEADSERRMFLLGYALLRRKDREAAWDGQRFTGTQARPGQALGAERGYSVVQFARERGAVVEDRYPRIDSLLESLKLGRLSGVLLNQDFAAQLLRDPAWTACCELGGPGLDTKAYYLPVSRALWQKEPQLVEALWTALQKVRATPEFARQFSLALSAGQRKDLKP